MKATFSNHLEELMEELKGQLFIPGSSLFEKRVIVVPNMSLKNYIMQAFAKDPGFRVAAGFKVINLFDAWGKMPSGLELSLFIEQEIVPMIEKDEALKGYFDHPAKDRRMGPFCDSLAERFLRLGIYGVAELNSWQKRLWEKIESKWRFPFSAKELESIGNVHVFGFSFLPKSFLRIFQKLSAKFYFFSPCAIFWGDFYSEKEQLFLKKQVTDSAKQDFEVFFDDQNLLLSNWGRVGRKMQLAIEEENLETNECYVEAAETSCLKRLQNSFLQGASESHSADSSLKWTFAPTKLREIEVLKDELMRLFHFDGITPSDVQVFAPNIGEYAPYIHAVFRDIPYGISDLEMKEVDPIASAFSHLMELPKKRFDLESTLLLFALPAFSEKFGISPDDISHFRKWLKMANVRWGYSKEQRKMFYLADVPEELMEENTDTGTWEKGLTLLLLDQGYVEQTYLERFNLLYTLIESLQDDLQPLIDDTRWTISQWIEYFLCLITTYFSFDSHDSLTAQFQQLHHNTHEMKKVPISFASAERMIQHILSKKNQSSPAPHLQSVQFSSLSLGGALPSPVIYLLGLSEEAFPRKETALSLTEKMKEFDYRPRKAEEDRYLFLQLLLSTRHFFFMSYSGVDARLSHIAKELYDQLENAEIEQHGSLPYIPKVNIQKSPLIEEFYENRELHAPQQDSPLIVDVKKLAKFARHPLRYFFHEQLKIFPSREIDHEEYLLSPITKFQLARDAMHTPLNEVLENAKQTGLLPLNMFEKFARQQIEKEVEDYKDALGFFEVGEVYSIHLRPFAKKIHQLENGDFVYPALNLKLESGREVKIVGSLENVTSKGLLVRAKSKLEDLICFWPQYLIMQHLNLGGLLLMKEKESFQISQNDQALCDYLSYFELATQHPSPLLPSFAKPLLTQGPEELQKALKKLATTPDEIFTWLFQRDPLPNAYALHANWSKALQPIFKSLVECEYAKV